MRIISTSVAAAIFAAQIMGAAAAPIVSPARMIKSETGVQLVKSKKKTKKHSKSKSRAGHCGTGKYFKNGKCLSAADKK